MSVLVTGFGPFGKEMVNPSGQIAELLDGTFIGGTQVFGTVLPVATERVGDLLAKAIDRVNPDLTIVLGLAPGRNAPALERVAINIRDFPIEDLDGQKPIDRSVVESGPDAYMTGLPIKAILTAWQEAGVPGYVSNTAGTYVCNQTFYLARHLSSAPVGLVHIPSTPQSALAGGSTSVPVPTMSLGVLEQAVRLTVLTALTYEGDDLPLSAGMLS
jgi:pyroglutamyl-peptidase